MSELTEKKPVGHSVEYSLDFLKNLGNYENIRIKVGIVVHGEGNPAPSLQKARDFVEEKLAVAVQEVTEAIQGN